MNVYLVRHGQTYANAEQKFAGIWDVSLNEIGEAQARRASEKLNAVTFDKIYASDLKRAFNTAEAIANGADIEPTPAFRELNFGNWEKKTIAEIKAMDQDGFFEWVKAYETFNAHGGESVTELYERVSAAYDAIVAAHGEDSDKNVLIVAHGGVIQALMSHICYGNISGYWRFRIDNCGINRVEYVMGYPVVRQINA